MRSFPELQRVILKQVAESKTPIGQGALSLLIRQGSRNVSVPTVGRKLQELEHEGLLRKVSVEGRVITVRGRRALEEWEAEAKLRGSGEALLKTLRQGDKRAILDLLDARRTIERETAALAAARSKRDAWTRMESALAKQGASVKQGDLGIEEDVRFHQEIALASGNQVLYSMVSLLRNHQRYNSAITSIRRIVGGRLVVDHRAILDAIVSRNPEGAREAMDAHLLGLAKDLDRYWGGWMKQSTGRQSRSGHRTNRAK